MTATATGSAIIVDTAETTIAFGSAIIAATAETTIGN
jgi:ribulose kinase